MAAGAPSEKVERAGTTGGRNGEHRCRCNYYESDQLTLGRCDSCGFFRVEPIEAFEDVHETWDGCFASPIPLKFAVQLDAAGHLAASLLDPTEASLVGSDRRSAYRVNRNVYLKAFPQGVKSGESQAHFCPKCGAQVP